MTFNNVVNDAIVVQTCANCATELILKTNPEQFESTLEDWITAFDRITEAVREKIGSYNSTSTNEGWSTRRNIPIVPSQQEIQQQLNIVKTGNLPAVEIAGKASGPIPAWLNRAAQKAGVVKVFDNRETATPENKRPQFVSADGNKVPFWAPKNPTTEDIGLKFGG